MELGTVLTDGSGRVLYLFTRDERNKSNCADQCAQRWPPLLTAGAPMAGEGTTAGLLGTIQRADGSTQVTYKGWPLYYWWQDEKPGDAKGQNVGSVWFVVSPAGEAIKTAMMAPTSTPMTAPMPTATSGSSWRASATPVNVSLANYKFTPGTLEVEAGKMAKFVLANDGMPHTFTIRAWGVDIDICSTATTQTVEFMVPANASGEVQLVCRFHEAAGMVGVIKVKLASGS